MLSADMCHSVIRPRSTKLTQQVAVNTHKCPNPAHTNTHIQRMHTPTVCVYTHTHTHTHTHISQDYCQRSLYIAHCNWLSNPPYMCQQFPFTWGQRRRGGGGGRGRKKSSRKMMGEDTKCLFLWNIFSKGQRVKKGCIPSVLSRWQIYCLNKIKNL